ncbi:sulfurtransferase [Prosthecobacter dejongeii]|uniref:Sulfurtransferase n=1 Tax=Prosthecobacter dejongeii TaxID=48465 RepID=A0A7W7YL33_9BACT|nr:sulfurtransferase [Prosthecobacter dejongeii]MBB5038213.1 thiosulfate/3-mercaptopyruvate sulfurtransferase [Prosthecobacter dejongeii]
MNSKFAAYHTPEILVDTDWLAANLETPGIRIIESNEDLLLYDVGHIPGAVHIDWRRDLNDQTTRDYIGPQAFAELCRRHGITPETTLVFYGDKSNWWACYAFWVFQLFGHTKAKILDGGRDKWEAENKPLTRSVNAFPASDYPVPSKRDDEAHRAYFQQTLEHCKAGKKLVDVRSPKEYSGEVTHMPEYPQEGVLRGGHIPGAKSAPWARAANADKTFKSREELEAIYANELGLKTDDDIIAYCRIGERSSHTWFVLKYLLGYNQVRNYDGSWTEWGNMVRTPIEVGA